MRMSPSCKCCYCQACRIAADQFDRPNGSDIGISWVESAGDWEILDGALTTTDSQAKAVYDLDHPLGVPAHVVTVKLKGDDPGDQLAVLIAIEDNGNYLLAQVTVGSTGGCGDLSLYSISAGVATLLNTVSVPELVDGAWHTLRVCYIWPTAAYEGKLAAAITTADRTKRSTSHAASSAGLQVGLATGAVMTRANFDAFCWQRHRTTEPIDPYTPAEPDCPACDVGHESCT